MPFKAPAHKHAHHLHSIPPREKSTRTLIIDHLLWVHARTRFAQARAELGMSDRTGGTHSPNYTHRERPENYEEDEDVYSEGESINSLVAREGGPGHTHEEDEDERLDLQDLTLARSLRQRAEGVEKVIAGMLHQPPPVHPNSPDEMLQPPTSPQLHPQSSGHQPGQSSHEHKLPNGVRLRLALGTVINDVFARRPPSPPSGHPTRSHSGILPPPTLPPVLGSLAAISLPPLVPTGRKPVPNDYIISLYNNGADPDSQNSPPALRCPRHLLMGCDICVEAKSNSRPSGDKKRGATARSMSTSSASPGDISGSTGGGNVFGLGGGVTGWQEGSGIGSGLSRPGPMGNVLRRPSIPGKSDFTDSPAAHTKLAELIVRFLRLSALVAIELGREAREDRASVDGDRDGPSTRPPTVSPLLTPRLLPNRNFTTADLHANALRPTRAWYFLLAGLLTRSVLEGYMTGGWRGIEPVEILLSIGLGLPPKQNDSPRRERHHPPDDPFDEFDPEDFPALEDAVKILFPSLREVNPAQGGCPPRRSEGAENEYEVEMTQRMSRFYDVPQSTPDVATHMEDLAWQYPAEVVERAACRFCEAVARWRGKPELETYKKASWIIGNKDSQSGATTMSIDSLVHSNPTSPTRPTIGSLSSLPALPPYQPPHPQISRKPIVDDYFSPPPSFMLQGRKRRRSEAERQDDGRRLYQIFS
ncbi:hypothetical protein BC835DRAFT_1271180 [Cytidiella melzeri]|nr:hypothetical protein BC835DRAFT_1271180 [Cytidiella melzeri]